MNGARSPHGRPTVICIALIFLAAACGESNPSASPATPSAAPSPPPGGPVPTQLLGDWFMAMPPTVIEAVTTVPCPSAPTAENCFFQLTLMATTSHAYLLASRRVDLLTGDVVVHNNEIDFFNGVYCELNQGLHLPDGVGRYTWKLTGGLLYLTNISDPCTRSHFLSYQGWSRTH